MEYDPEIGFSSNSYQTALNFFKEKDAFLYRYQWVDARYVVAIRTGRATTSFPMIVCPGANLGGFTKTRCAYYQAASYYLNNVHVRVSGTNGDSGVLLLRDLIDTYNGSYCSRYLLQPKSISSPCVRHGDRPQRRHGR